MEYKNRSVKNKNCSEEETPEKSLHEPNTIFEKRLDFFNKAMKLCESNSIPRFNLKYVNILANCYANVERFKVSYPLQIEDDIKRIISLE